MRYSAYVPRLNNAATAGASAIPATRHEFVLGCGATNVLAADFVAGALPWFKEPKTAAIFGRIDQGSMSGPVHRWRHRHWFKLAAAERLAFEI